MNTTLLIIWLAAVIIFAVVEIVTIQLVAIWLAVGSVAAMIACTLGSPLWVQIMVFGAVSLILLLLTRPLVKRLIKVKPVSTNADRLIGKAAIVTESIYNLKAHGTVVISGITWNARSEDNSEIEKGEKVIIKAIEGSKLIVAKSLT